MTHQLQAECAAVGRGIVHGVVTLFVPHARISIVPKQILYAPGATEVIWRVGGGGVIKSSMTRDDQDGGPSQG